MYLRGSHTQHTTHHQTKTTQHNTDNQHPNSQPNYCTTSRWKTPTRFLLSRRALRSESWGSDIVRRALALLHSRPEAVIFRRHFFVWFMPDVAHGRSCCSLRPCCLSRVCLRSEGGKLNRVEGQSCCAAVLTARLSHTEGGRRPQGILHMKRVWSTKHSIILPGTVQVSVFDLAVCSSSHSMGRGGAFSKFLPTHADS